VQQIAPLPSTLETPVPDDQKDTDEIPPSLIQAVNAIPERTTEVPLGPHGTLYSYTFVHFPLFGSMKMEHIGYGVGQVDMDEGPRVQFPLAGAQADFRVGQTLEAELDPIREDGDRDVVILRFRPIEVV
jgi:uncharacterized OB-fold protein